MTNGFQRLSRFFVIFHDFRAENTHFLRVQNTAHAHKKKKVAGMGSVLRGQNRLPTGENFIRFRYRADFFSKARLRSIDLALSRMLPNAAERCPRLPNERPSDPRRGGRVSRAGPQDDVRMLKANSLKLFN